jgi:hypothetical protein
MATVRVYLTGDLEEHTKHITDEYKLRDYLKRIFVDISATEASKLSGISLSNIEKIYIIIFPDKI